MRILIVDDEKELGVLFARFLSRRGHECRTALSLAEAREASQGGGFDAVLLDQFLPDGNGLDFIAALRAAAPRARVVMVSGVGDPQGEASALKAGADRFLAKPVDLKLLADCLAA